MPRSRPRRQVSPGSASSGEEPASLDTGLVYPLSDFAIGELVLVRNVNRKDAFWPVRKQQHATVCRHLTSPRKERAISHLRVGLQAVVVDPAQGAPEVVRRQRPDGKLCAKFYGPAFNKVPSWPAAVQVLRGQQTGLLCQGTDLQTERSTSTGIPHRRLSKVVISADRKMRLPVCTSAAVCSVRVDTPLQAICC